MAAAEFTCVLDCRATLGECPVWSTEEQALYFVDIKAPALLRFDPEGGDLRAMPMPEHIGSFALMRSGGFLAAMRSGIFRLDRDGNVVAKLADNPEAHTSRFNDGRCDPHGRFYVGTMDETRKGLSALYRFADGELVKMTEPPPPAMRCGSAALTVFQTPVRLMPIVSCQAASSSSRAGVGW